MTTATTTRRTAVWVWMAAGALLAVLALALGAAVAVFDLVDQAAGHVDRGVEIVIDGRRIELPLAVMAQRPLEAIAALAVMFVALALVLMLLVPLALLLMGGVVAIPMLPVVALGTLLWLVLRRRRPAGATSGVPT